MLTTDAFGFCVENPPLNVVCCRVWADSVCIKHLWQRFSQWIDPKPNDLNATLGRERLNDVLVCPAKFWCIKRIRIIQFI